MVVIKILRTQHLVYRPTKRWNNQKTLAKQYAPFFQEGHENYANEFVCQLFILAKLISLLSSDHIHNNRKQENNFIYKIIFIVMEVKSSTMTILIKVSTFAQYFGISSVKLKNYLLLTRTF